MQVDRSGNAVRDEHGVRKLYSRGEAETATAKAAMAVTAVTAAAAPSGPEGPFRLRFDERWRMSIWGTSIGRTGMIPVDLDGDGSLEIVMGMSGSGGFFANNAWMIARYTPGRSSYEIVWSSPPSAADVSRIEVHRIGGQQRIFVGLEDGTLQVYDGAGRALLRTLGVSDGAIRAILLDDADNDGSRELVVATEQSIHLLDPVTYAARGSIALGAVDVAVGNVDADPQLEIVLANGPVLQYDGSALVTEWDFSTFAAGTYLALADVDADGIEEIVSARAWDYIDVYDADLKSPKYQISSDYDIQSLLIADVNRDGRDEILYGDGQWGEIHVHDGASGSPIWQVRNPEHGTTRIAVADVDGDGQLEVMWGAGWTSTGPDHFYVHEIPSLAREFESIDVVGPFAAVAMGDVDDDGGEEIVAISSAGDSGYADGVVHVFDAHTFALEWQSGTDLFGRFAWTGIHDVAIGDVDGDGATEIVVATDRLYDGRIFVIDGKSHAVERQYGYDSGSPMQAVELVDLDADGDVEILAANSAAHSGSPGTFVWILDGASGAVVWKSVSLSSSYEGIYALEAADLDGGGTAEIIVSLDSVIVVDGESRTLSRSSQKGVRAIALADLDQDGKTEIWAGSATGQLLRFDPSTLAATEVASLCAGPVNSLAVGRTESLSRTIQFACDDALGIYGVLENTVLWRSLPIGRSVGLSDNLRVANRDGQMLLLAGTQTGVVGFQSIAQSTSDLDTDGIFDFRDNCPEVANADQRDSDGDGVGDACNDASDRDGDEWADSRDVCPAIANPSQSDTDLDGTGDACNDAIDLDGDEWSDSTDNCLELANGDQGNRDGDEFGDSCDPYPDNPDHYAARCDEAIVNESLLAWELAECRAQVALDGDGDGESDGTDRCPGTTGASEVDSAGCSQQQFCAANTGMGVWSALRCLASDWNNDEPLQPWPSDCRLQTKRRQSWLSSVHCGLP